MMELFVSRGFPVLLLMGAIYLAWREWTQPLPGPVGRRRLFRRWFGSGLLVVVAGLIWTGQVPHGHPTPEQTSAMLTHWLTVFGVVFVLVGLALWDTWEGVRHLRSYLEVVERDELDKIRGHLDRSRGGRLLLRSRETGDEDSA